MSDTNAIQSVVDQLAHDLSKETGLSVQSLRSYATNWGQAAVDWGLKLAQCQADGDVQGAGVMELNIREVVAGAKLEAAIYGIEAQSRVEGAMVKIVGMLAALK